VEYVESYVPPGDLLVDRSNRVDFISETFSEPLENVVGSEGDS